MDRTNGGLPSAQRPLPRVNNAADAVSEQQSFCVSQSRISPWVILSHAYAALMLVYTPQDLVSTINITMSLLVGLRPCGAGMTGDCRRGQSCEEGGMKPKGSERAFEAARHGVRVAT